MEGDLNQLLPPPATAAAPVAPPAPTGPKHDGFYKYWDRFLRVKERNKADCKTSKVKFVESADARTRSGSIRNILAASRREADATAVEKPTRDALLGESLDRDVEGRPSHLLVRSNTAGIISHQSSTTSYEEAAASCRAKVDAIRHECRRLNQKYYDRMFNLPQKDTLLSLDASEEPSSLKALVGVGSVKRVEDIYDEPEFFIDGATANDIRQGINGDCWFLAAISALTSKPELIDRVCVARDEKVGVYGFVFFRDGEWISEVVDDRLCLRPSDDTKNFSTEYMVITDGGRNPLREPLVTMPFGVTTLPQEFRDKLRKGSNALFFASCRESNETWLPLMEKAYAKAHGDYQAIEGGFAGEGIEDLTGGIATYISSEDILDKDKLWSELLQVNDKFLFGCGSREGRDYDPADDEGFVRGHAYTVLEAKEIDKPRTIIAEEERKAKKAGRVYSDKKREEKVRMLKLKNPWGRQEWNGSWSDGSKEWTPEVMRDLNHTFGDDGIFWISYGDFLKYYPEIDRVRLIGPEWTVTQQWTTVRVPYTVDYLDTYFSLDVKDSGPVVVVLSQPDERYYRGLQGRFTYELHFRLYKDGEDTYLLRSMESAGSDRSCTAELDLEPGRYTILVKITAKRNAQAKTAEEVIKEFRESRRDKLTVVGKSLDAVHSKGRLRDMEEADARKDRDGEKADDRQAKKEERDGKKKLRIRERARRKRREDEVQRKTEEKIRLAREKKKAEKDALKKEKSKCEVSTSVAGPEKDGAVEQSKSVDVTTVIDPPGDEPHSPKDVKQSTSDQSDKIASKEKDESGQTSAEIAIDPSKDNVSSAVAGVGKVDAARIEAKGEPDSEHASKSGSNGGEEALAIPTVDKPREKLEQTPIHKDEDVEDDAEDNVSDCSSVHDEDFEWDDAIDGSGDEIDQVDNGNSVSDSEDEDDMFKDDPWCARCVIGLRVCSLDKEVVVKVHHGDLE